MEKHLARIAISSLVVLSASAFSQVSVQPGLVLGDGNYWLTDNGTFTNAGTTTGLLAGGVLDISCSKHFSIQSGIEYSEQGYSTFQTPSGIGGIPGIVTVDDKFDELVIPLNFKAKFPILSMFSPYALAGLNLGMVLRTTGTWTQSGLLVEKNVETGNFKTDLGFVLGAGVDFHVENVVPFFEMNYLVADTYLLGYAGFEIKAGIRFKM